MVYQELTKVFFTDFFVEEDFSLKVKQPITCNTIGISLTWVASDKSYRHISLPNYLVYYIITQIYTHILLYYTRCIFPHLLYVTNDSI
jgi:hypothetical protein